MVLKINSETSDNNVGLKSVVASCGLDVHFVEVSVRDINAGAAPRVEILIPSMSAMFDMQMWSHANQL